MRMELDIRLRRRSGFTLEVRTDFEGERVGVVGPTGSGKTTLLDVIAGFESGGKVRLDGDDLSAKQPRVRAIGTLFQEALLFPHLSVLENLRYSPRAHAESQEEVRTVAALGIGPLLDRRPGSLSVGERRKVALARAILSRPQLLLLDEPFTGLDAASRRGAMSLLHQIGSEWNVPWILVSHRPEEVISLTDWSLRLEGGRVVAQGTSGQVCREESVDPGNPGGVP